MKFIVVPIEIGRVEWATDRSISVKGPGVHHDIMREDIVGRQPDKYETVAVFSLDDLLQSLREGDNQQQRIFQDLVEVAIEGEVKKRSQSAVWIKTDARTIILPAKYCDLAIGEWVHVARVPKWMAAEKHLAGVEAFTELKKNG